MKSPSSIVSCLCFVLGIGFSPLAEAEESWRIGSVAVTAVSGEVVLEEVGGSHLKSSELRLPEYLAGQLRIRAAEGGGVFLRASNGVRLQAIGDGYFAIERFEQSGGLAELADVGPSRLIANLRGGMLLMDNRMLDDLSLVVLESPVGRLSASSALWLMRISYDERSRLYSFSIECMEGALRFTDVLGNNYTLRNGRRLTGVGGLNTPSIEMGGTTGEARDHLGRFVRFSESLAELDLSAAAYRAEMRPLGKAGRAARSSADERGAAAAGDRRPLIIEYAPRPSPVTPFRGRARPPSEHEVDIF